MIQKYGLQRHSTGSGQRTLFLHIGTGKAGSTSLQHSFHMLKDPSMGLLPVRAFGFPNATRLTMASRSAQAHSYFVERHKVVSKAEFEENADMLWKKARSEIEASRVERFVASSEFLSSMVRGKDIEMLKRELETLFDHIEIIIYLREQKSFLRSLWAQSIKGPSKSIESFSKFLAGLEKREKLWNYSIFLKDWLRVFGADAITVTMFDPQALHNGNVIADFFHKAGLEDVPIEMKTKKNQNVTPSLVDLEAIRRKNIARNEAAVRATKPVSDEQEIEPDQYEVFVLEKVSEGNRWVNTMFFTDQPVKLPVA